MITKKFRIRVVAFLFMLICSPVVFGMVIFMNNYVHTPEGADGGGVVSFQVQQHVPMKKPEQEKIIPKRRAPRPSPRAIAPIPSIGTSLSGIQIDMPEFASDAFDSLTRGAFGSSDLPGNVVMTEETVDERPTPIKRPNLEYPARALAMNLTGYVTMNILIDRNGLVKTVQVLESQPAGVFDETAVSSMRSWEFKPATYQQQAVEVWARQTIWFDLG